MEFTRILCYGASGGDVLYIKRRLFERGWYEAGVLSIVKSRFGGDTLRAVRRFQAANGLPPSRANDEATWRAIEERAGRAPALTAGADEPLDAGAAIDALPDTLSATARGRIAPALAAASPQRRAIVLDALAFAFDAGMPRAYPLSLYIRGGNLYNKDLTKNVITLARIAAGAKKQPEFYDGGRREMMERAVRANPSITGADCSGGVVGLLRHAHVVPAGFDTTADGFYGGGGNTKRISREALLPADLLHRKGHIGLFAGGGYAVEWMGGAFGCQLSALSDRRGYNFVTGRSQKMSAWTGFLRPTYDEA